MRSRLPKMLHEICGRPMIDWTVAAARESGAGSVVVVGSPDGALEGRLPDGVALAVQPQADGTGGAVLAAADHLHGDGTVLVVNGDAPLDTAAPLRAPADSPAASGGPPTLGPTTPDHPAGPGP